MARGYRRALLKISGEALAGDRAQGLDPEKTSWIAEQIARAVRDGREIGIVVGGGNILRGIDAAKVGVPRLIADQMGMIATVINGMALRSALHAAGIAAVTMSAFPVGGFVEPFNREKALEYLARGTVLIFSGGTGNPCFTTDSAAALRSVEIEAEVMIKCTQVDGVYDKDPKTNTDARIFTEISAAEVVNKQLGVMDATCAEILGHRQVPAIVLNLHVDDNVRRALTGEKIGTMIS